jgi:hypothetical protein
MSQKLYCATLKYGSTEPFPTRMVVSLKVTDRNYTAQNLLAHFYCVRGIFHFCYQSIYAYQFLNDFRSPSHSQLARDPIEKQHEAAPARKKTVFHFQDPWQINTLIGKKLKQN